MCKIFLTGLDGGNDETACDTLLYCIEDCRSVVFPSRFLLRSNKMDDETKETKANEFKEKTLPSLIEQLEKHMTGDKWLLPEVC